MDSRKEKGEATEATEVKCTMEILMTNVGAVVVVEGILQWDDREVDTWEDLAEDFVTVKEEEIFKATGAREVGAEEEEREAQEDLQEGQIEGEDEGQVAAEG